MEYNATLNDCILNVKKMLDEGKDCLEVLSEAQRDTLSKNERKELMHIIRDFRNADSSVFAAVFIYVVNCPDEGIDFIRKRGIISYYNNWSFIDKCLDYLIDSMDYISISINDRQYLLEKKEGKWFSKAYLDIDKRVLNMMKNHYEKRIRKVFQGQPMETSLFMELLAFLDIHFRIESGYSQPSPTIIDKNQFEQYSKEDIGEAVSSLIYLYMEKIGINKEKHIWIDADYVLSQEIEDMVLLILKRNTLIKWELLQDYYGYTLKEKNGKWNLSDERVNLEKSIRAGYVKNELQDNVFLKVAVENEGIIPSLADLARELYSAKDNIFERTGDIGFFRRFRMKFVEPIIKALGSNNNTELLYYIEEIKDIAQNAHNYYAEAKDFLYYKISNNCFVSDVILIRRFFSVFTFLQNMFFTKHVYEKNNKKVIREHLKEWIRSSTPVFTKEKLISIFKEFVNDKADELLELLSWDGIGKLDLQYTPIIRIDDDHYYIVPYVMASSNLIRNIVVNERQKKMNQQNDFSDGDLLEKKTEQIFKNCKFGFESVKNLHFTYNGEPGEVDLVVWKEDYLYIMECKQSILPAGDFELRQTFDYIVKGNKQLKFSQSAFCDPKFRDKYFEGWGIPNKEWKMIPCVILGNRLFTIQNGFQYPVRYIGELDNILNTGVLDSSVGKWRYWENEDFTEEDLCRFLSKADPLSFSIFNAMKPVDKVLTVGKKSLVYKSFYFDISSSFELRKKYFTRIIEKADKI